MIIDDFCWYHRFFGMLFSQWNCTHLLSGYQINTFQVGGKKEEEHFEGFYTSVINLVIFILNYLFKDIFRNHTPFS